MFVEYCFKECTYQPQRFFNILPQDWYENIAPYWKDCQHSARIYILESDTEVLGGGIVFTKVSPDTHHNYKAAAQAWFNKGYLYIGFLWFYEKHRNQQLGSKWLQNVFALFPHQKFWLTIDEYRLAAFYIRHGFQLIERIEFNDYPEWIMVQRQDRSEA